jgi:hypothetical protein
MSIYHAYFSGVNQTSFNIKPWGEEPRFVSPLPTLTEMLEKTQHKVVFIITPEQEDSWNVVYRKYHWQRFLHFEMPNFVHNVNYPDRGRRLKVIVLKGIGDEA